MKKALFIIALSFVVSGLSAQKFEYVKETNEFYSKNGRIYRRAELPERLKIVYCKSKDSCVYREKGFLQRLEKYGEKPIGERPYYLPDLNDNDAVQRRCMFWFIWLCVQALPKEIVPVIENAAPNNMMLNFGHCDLFQGLLFEIYFDRQGNIVTVSFFVAEDVRDKITQKHLRSMYKAIVKEKLSEDVMITIKMRKDDGVRNSDCFMERIDVGDALSLSKSHSEELRQFEKKSGK